MSAARTQRKERLRANHRRMRELERQVVLDNGDAADGSHSVLRYIESAWVVGLTVNLFAHDERQLQDVYVVETADPEPAVVGFLAVTPSSVTASVTD